MNKVFIATFFLLTSGFSQAGISTTADLIKQCRGVKNPNEAEKLLELHCLGYVSGVLDGIQMVFGVKPESKFLCLPESGSSVEQTLDAVNAMVREKPEDLAKSARISILISLVKKYPCG